MQLRKFTDSGHGWQLRKFTDSRQAMDAASA
jgi:hypothetical protein